MPRWPEKTKPPVAETPAETPLPVEAPNARVDKGRSQVFNASGVFVREYNAEIHGEKYDELAHEFAKKKGYSVRYVILT